MSYRDIVAGYSGQNGTGATLSIKSMINGKEVSFAAFLTGLSQNFKSNWDASPVFGRNDPIATFQNTTRTVSIGWAVPAASLEEAKNNEIKISNLITFLYPGYLDATPPPDPSSNNNASPSRKNFVMSKSPLVKVKFANIIQAQVGDGLLGWIDGIDWKPKIDSGMFAEGGNFYAKSIDLSINLNVLHQQDLGTDQNGNWIGNSTNFPFKLE